MPAVSLKELMQPFGETGVEYAGAGDWGEISVAQSRLPAGYDGEEMVRQIGGDGLCSAPHWGYVISGVVGVRYTDGHEEFARAGETFYLPPGHAPFSVEGAEVVEFTPAAAAAEMMAKATAAYGSQG